MKILKFKKMSKGRYKITLDKEGEFILYEDVIFKNDLLIKKDIDLPRLEKILDENIYYEAYNLTLSYIEYKLRSKKEIRIYLTKKNFDENIINKVIEELSNKGYINDSVYSKAFISDKISFTNHGPYKIKMSLIDSGVDETIASEELNKIDDSIFEEKIKKIIEKRKKVNKSPQNIFINKTIDYLCSLGYDKTTVVACVTDKTYDIEDNVYIDQEKEFERIRKEYDKLYSKYSKKYEGYKLKYQIKSALYRKGYNKELIESVVE